MRVAGVDVTGEPYHVRRSILADLVDSEGSVVKVPGSWAGIDPKAVLTAAADLNLEGIVCKHLRSTYTPGLRSPDWIKTPLRKRDEFIIGGWVPGSGVNRHTVGALLVGAYDTKGDLQFCGMVSAGLSDGQRRRLLSELGPLERTTSPFAALVSDAAAHTRWVRPELVGDIEYRELGTTLRHPSWKGLRVDSDSARVTLPAAG